MSVTVVFQDGNYARFSGEVRNLRLGGNTNEGLFFEVRVLDGGEPSAGVDMIFVRRDEAPIDCGSRNNMVPWPVTEGNVQVHEAK